MRFAAVLAVLIALGGAVLAAAPQPNKPFDAARMPGRWYEIARTPGGGFVALFWTRRSGPTLWAG